MVEQSSANFSSYRCLTLPSGLKLTSIIDQKVSQCAWISACEEMCGSVPRASFEVTVYSLFSA